MLIILIPNENCFSFWNYSNQEHRQFVKDFLCLIFCSHPTSLIPSDSLLDLIESEIKVNDLIERVRSSLKCMVVGEKVDDFESDFLELLALKMSSFKMSLVCGSFF